MRRFLLLLVTRRWGWTLIALLIILGGSLWGLSSSTIPFVSSTNSSYYMTATGNGDVYIWTTDNSTFYVARHNDFNPPIDRTQIHLDAHLTFVARSDTVSVNQDLVDNVHASQAHIIEELTLYNQSGGLQATYDTSDYKANPKGYFESRWWPGSVAAIVAGLLVAYAALFVGRKKRSKTGTPPASQPGSWPYAQIPPYPTSALTPPNPQNQGASQQSQKP